MQTPIRLSDLSQRLGGADAGMGTSTLRYYLQSLQDGGYELELGWPKRGGVLKLTDRDIFGVLMFSELLRHGLSVKQGVEVMRLLRVGFFHEAAKGDLTSADLKGLTDERWVDWLQEQYAEGKKSKKAMAKRCYCLVMQTPAGKLEPSIKWVTDKPSMCVLHTQDWHLATHEGRAISVIAHDLTRIFEVMESL